MLAIVVSSTQIVETKQNMMNNLEGCLDVGLELTDMTISLAPPVKFNAIPEDMRTKSIECGCPIVLQCVVSDPEALVGWYKDETQIISNPGLEIQSEGNTRTLVVQSAELSHSGVYRCTTQDDTMDFHVEIKGDFTFLSFTLIL